MKKLLGIVVLGLLWCNLSFAEETPSFEWVKNQTKFIDTMRLVGDDKQQFQKFIKSNMSTRQFFDFKDETLYQEFISVLLGPPNQIKYLEDRRYLVGDACMAHYCIAKGLFFIDTKEKHVIGVIRHFYTEPFDLDKTRKKSEDFLIFSKTHKKFENLPELFLESVDDWIKGADDFDPINPQVIRFIGTDDLIKDSTDLFKNYIRPLSSYSLLIEEDGDTAMFIYRYPNSKIVGEIMDYGNFKWFSAIYKDYPYYETSTFIQPANLGKNGDMNSWMLPNFKLDNFHYKYISKKDYQILNFSSKNVIQKIEEYISSKSNFSLATLSEKSWYAGTFLPVTNTNDLKLLIKKNTQTFCKILSNFNVINQKNRELKTKNLTSLLNKEKVKCD